MIRIDLVKICISSFVLFWVATATVAQVNPQSGAALKPAQAYAVQAEGAAYADIADLVTIAPVIIDAQVTKTTKVLPEQSVGVPANLQRMLIEAKVVALIRGQGGVLPVVKFLLDVPKDTKGKTPKLKKARFFMMASQVAGRPGEIRLVRPAALVSYSPANDAMVRAITQEAVLIDAPQKITGIASAFYSPGTVIGDGETQIFLTTEKNQPFALSISSRAGQPKKWSVSTSEVIEESAMAPIRYTLMWYSLACGLPRSLPAEQVESAESDSAARAEADYQHVLETLGPCGRKR